MISLLRYPTNFCHSRPPWAEESRRMEVTRTVLIVFKWRFVDILLAIKTQID